MDNTEYPVRIVKFGIVFFGDKAVATFSGDGVSINTNGSSAYQFKTQDIKSGAVNDTNGLWTIKLKDGRKLNIVGLGSTKSDFNSKLDAIMERVG